MPPSQINQPQYFPLPAGLGFIKGFIPLYIYDLGTLLTRRYAEVCWLNFGQASLQEELAVATALLPPTSSEAVISENRPAHSAQPGGGRFSRIRPGLEVRLQEASPEPGCSYSLTELQPDGAAA